MKYAWWSLCHGTIGSTFYKKNMVFALYQIYQKTVEIFFHFSNTRWEYSLVLKRIQRKQTFRLTHRRWGRFARRNVCNSATEIPYRWRKICPESGHKRCMIGRRIKLHCFSFCLWMTDKRQKATKVKCKRGESITKTVNIVEYILLCKKHLSFVGACSQMNTTL